MSRPPPVLSSLPDVGFWFREGMAGLAGAVIGVALLLTLGSLAFAPLGRGAIEFGVPAAFVAVVIGGSLFARFSRLPMPTAGPSSATAIVFADLVATLLNDPVLHAAPDPALLPVVAMGSAAVALMGLFQLAFGQLGLGALAKFVPQPVLAGFMNGVALLIVASQVPVLLGIDLSTWRNDGLHALGAAQPATLAIGLLAAGTAWGVARLWPRLPAALLAVGVASLAYAALQRHWPQLALGAQVGALPARLAAPDAMLALWPGAGVAAGLLARHWPTLLSTAWVLAVVGSLESSLAIRALAKDLDGHADTNRELRALGLANLASGLFAGLPLVFSQSRSINTWRAGGRSPIAAVAGALLLVPMLLWGGPLLAQVPRAVLAGLMLTIALGVMDGWTRQLVSQLAAGERARELRRSLVVVIAVCAATFGFGFVAGVVIGIVLSALFFLRTMNRSLLRRQLSGSAQPSRRLYPPMQEALLRPLRTRIVVLELEGALFFGSVERLVEEARQHAVAGHFLVLDLRRVNTIDASGAVLLERLSQQLHRDGVPLLLAGLWPTHRLGRALRACGTFRGEPRDDWFVDADHAIEAAEQQLLARAGASPDAAVVALRDCALLAGLTPAQVETLQRRLRPLPLAAGQILFRQGEPGDRLYVLTQGSVTAQSPATDTADPVQRFFSISPGMTFGETAMLDRQGRSATVVADRPSLVHELTAADLEALGRAEPALGLLLYRNIATHLSARLRDASAAWRAMSE